LFDDLCARKCILDPLRGVLGRTHLELAGFVEAHLQGQRGKIVMSTDVCGDEGLDRRAIIGDFARRCDVTNDWGSERWVSRGAETACEGTVSATAALRLVTF
jgi:hypothetical protein